MSVLGLKHLESAVTVMEIRREMDEEIRGLLMGKVLKRIRKFAETYDTDADGLVLSREVERDFAKDRDHEFRITVAIDGDLRMVAHFLTKAVEYYGRWYIWILQMEVDPGSGLTIEQERKCFQLVRDWRAEIGAHGIRAAASTPAQLRRFQMICQGKPHMTLVRWEVQDG